jgi:hypothetical protein
MVAKMAQGNKIRKSLGGKLKGNHQQRLEGTGLKEIGL